MAWSEARAMELAGRTGSAGPSRGWRVGAIAFGRLGAYLVGSHNGPNAAGFLARAGGLVGGLVGVVVGAGEWKRVW